MGKTPTMNNNSFILKNGIKTTITGKKINIIFF